MYHPPYSTKNRISNTVFIDGFIEFPTNIIPIYNHEIVVGDFNLHLNNADPDADAEGFENAMDALGLVPHVKFPTHNLGNALHQVYCELNKVSTYNCHKRPAISDHYYAVLDTSRACSNSCAMRSKIRNLKGINQELLK